MNILRLLLLGIITVTIYSPVFAAENLTQAKRDSLNKCLQELPGSYRSAFNTPSERTHFRVSKRLRPKWRECISLERDLKDLESVRKFSADLISIAVRAGYSENDVTNEAKQIANQMVSVTRKRSEEINMVGSPLFNNLLVHIGAKKSGFCYQWTTTLMQNTNNLPWKYFKREWGVANLAKVTENNAYLISARGADFQSAIVYDAWRGAGNPYWRTVSSDHYKWKVRYTEKNIQMGLIDNLDENSK